MNSNKKLKKVDPNCSEAFMRGDPSPASHRVKEFCDRSGGYNSTQVIKDYGFFIFERNSALDHEQRDQLKKRKEKNLRNFLNGTSYDSRDITDLVNYLNDRFKGTVVSASDLSNNDSIESLVRMSSFA